MEEIIDIHSHVLPNTDDGVVGIASSKIVLRIFKEIGITKAILTPHYIENSIYSKNKTQNEETFKETKQELKKDNVQIKLYLGNEIFINDNVVDLLEKEEICTLAGSQYVLLELPMGNFINVTKILCELNAKHYIPVIAHIERYPYFWENYSLVNQLLEYGCLFQSNVGSLSGKYGNQAKQFVKYLLKKNLITFIGSDVHTVNGARNLKSAYKKLHRFVGDEKFKELTYTNPKKILDKEPIEFDIKYLKAVM